MNNLQRVVCTLFPKGTIKQLHVYSCNYVVKDMDAVFFRFIKIIAVLIGSKYHNIDLVEA